MESPVLSAYTDYRVYLKDEFAYRQYQTRTQRRPYSYTDFSAAADIKSPNYLKTIIEGQRNLSPEMIKKFARALKLDKQEFKEFEALVFYGQEKDPLQRNSYLKNLSEIRAHKALEAGEIEKSVWDKVPNWISWVLYAMVDQEHVRFDPKHLKELLRHKATPAELEAALNRLKDNGDIKLSETGEAHKTGLMMNEAQKIPPALVRKLQAELIYLGLESLYKDEPTEREISGFTLAMTPQEFQWVRHELRKVRKDLQSKLMMEREKAPGERVYQVNVQMFPLTEKAAFREPPEVEPFEEKEKGPEGPNTGDKDI